MQERFIFVKGARQHNLKNIDLKIPRDKLIVITGVSGSGKSSLAFDTIYAEGQRRYVESLSPYARQFLELMEKPDVDLIEGLSPAIAIEQKAISKNPRSTVGTVTEIYDYLRVLFARVGKPFCPTCNIPISAMTITDIIDEILSFPVGTKIIIESPIVRGRKGEYKKELELYKRKGFSRARIDGEIIDLNTDFELNKNIKHHINLIIDRLIIKEGIRSRLADSVEMATKISGGILEVEVVDGERFSFNQNFACNTCGFTFTEITPRMFSFNNPYGACSTCDGLGVKKFFDPKLIVNEELSLREGAITPWTSSNGTILFLSDLLKISEYFSVKGNTPFKKFPEEMREFILYGKSGFYNFQLEKKVPHFLGVIPWLEERYQRTYYSSERDIYERYVSYGLCPACQGKRLKKDSLFVKIGDKNISEITAMNIEDCYKFFQGLKFKGKDEVISAKILKEIKERLEFLLEVGLSYLTLERSAQSLSGGESQRINLATQIGSKLMGVLYVLDEPTIGLHPRDNTKLINTLKNLRDLGNTVIVVEHDKEMIESADWVIDLGPYAGENGGNVIFQGASQEIFNDENSLTGKYLSGLLSISVEKEKRVFKKDRVIKIFGAKENNLKNIDVEIPLESFVCVTGVSGSGKSSLVIDTLYKACAIRLMSAKEKAGKYDKITGLEYVDKVIDVDQSPIGRTPRSNPATYVGVYSFIREVFAMVPQAKVRGYGIGRFSFNVSGGRCEVCKGEGYIKVEMHFMPDVYVVCDHCNGMRFNRETLEIRYKDKNIYEVLNMTVSSALKFFENHPQIVRMLQVMEEVGLGYIRLGQPATTLSGGEAQRIKLAKELVKKNTGKTLYILDEPTTGLHFDDIRKLLQILHRLVSLGNTVVVIEHNIDVIKTADWIIDLGPEGGDNGGYIVAKGTVKDIIDNEKSYTGFYLKKELSRTL
ncbi:MAG: excinuclease ABC subunit UvrA [Proteobacteria bacterium]|nr:excinuclease ABC subunit UvrA [Pseudomonadota bacterium]